MTYLRLFSQDLCQVHVITSSFGWFTGLSVPFVIGQVINLVLVLRYSIKSHSLQCILHNHVHTHVGIDWYSNLKYSCTSSNELHVNCSNLLVKDYLYHQKNIQEEKCRNL